jgi:hypothetical protein
MQIHQINVAPSFALINVVFVNSLNTLSSGGIYSQSGFRAFVSHRTRTPRVLDLQRKFRVSECVLAARPLKTKNNLLSQNRNLRRYTALRKISDSHHSQQSQQPRQRLHTRT